LPRIFDQLPSNLRAIAERGLRDEAVVQICKDYDDVLAALDRAEAMQEVATESCHAILMGLQEELAVELVQVLEEKRLRGSSNDDEK
jgi:hypothetical protein